MCVVKLLPSGSAPDSASQYLLVQRPDKGLLAGTHAPPPLSCICLLLHSDCHTDVKYIMARSRSFLHVKPAPLSFFMVHAGLWEFPSWVVGFAAAPDMVSLGEIVDNSLPELIGTISMSALGSLHIVRRLQLGTVLHTFSHIQQTMHVELLVLQVCSWVYIGLKASIPW